MGQGTTLETRNLRRIAGYIRHGATEAFTSSDQAFSAYGLKLQKLAEDLEARACDVERVDFAASLRILTHKH
jgi:hypothetical protein